MNHYLAPLEGITGLSFRRMHSKYFGGVDRYYMPFLSPTQNHCLSPKEERELSHADREPYEAVPQILTKSPEDFLWAVDRCVERGYREVNLNMGCPSGTVFSKGKGSGMLRDLAVTERFLDEIFSRCPVPISVKTRVGVSSAEEFPQILELLNKYPIQELTIHPRVRKAFYDGAVELDAFAYAAEHCKHRLCYNGDIRCREDLQYIRCRFPAVSSVMLGRGLITDPGLLCGGTKRQTLLNFHEELLEEYCRLFSSKVNAVARMKDIWKELLGLFEDAEKLGKELKKTVDYESYRSIAHRILTELPIHPSLAPGLKDTVSSTFSKNLL